MSFPHPKLRYPTVATTHLRGTLGIAVTVDFLLRLGAQPAFQNTHGALWFVHDVPKIAGLVAAHLMKIANKPPKGMR